MSLAGAVALPRGTVTFLFTDVEGSTRAWEEYPDLMRAALARHDEIVVGVIAEHDGVVVKPRGEGDSQFCVFAKPTEALAAGLAIQRAVTAEPWSTPRPVRVRMSLHTGEADVREGDYYGPTVNRAARLRAIAHGGQTVLSQSTYDLVRDTLPAGASLTDMGEHRLKDLTRAEHVWQLCHPQLPGEFPALVSLDRARHNLPVQRTSFVGRDAEVAAVARSLADHHLVTLTGPGGTGKTRLALQAAAEVVEDFADGVWLIPLASVTDPDLLPSTVAQTLGVTEKPGEALVDTLRDWLGGKSVLLVVDNLEQLLPAAAVTVSALLDGPGVRILATSRERLSISGEHEHPVATLSTPATSAGPVDLGVLNTYEAVRLFVERAAEAKAGFAVTNENAPAVAAICARLDGLPLAIELAAARVRLLPPKALLERLEKSLDVLSAGARDAPERHRTLRATIAWSYDLLAPSEQSLLAQLSVFRGGFTLDAAEEVCEGVDVFEGVASLLDKSLVREMGSANEDARFTMLETVREFADDLLIGDEREVALERHLTWVQKLVVERAPDIVYIGARPDEVAWIEHLDRERDNLRTALQRAMAVDPGALCRMVGELWRYWAHRSVLSEAKTPRDRALAVASGVAPATRLRVLAAHISMMLASGVDESSMPALEEAVALSVELGDVRREAYARLCRAFVDQQHARIDHYQVGLERALDVAAPSGDEGLIGLIRANLAELHFERADGPRAAEILEDLQGSSAAMADAYLRCICSLWLSRIASAEGDTAVATHHLAAAEAVIEDHAVGALMGSVALARAELHLSVGDEALSVRTLGGVLPGLADHQERHFCTDAVELLARSLSVLRPRAAARLLGAADSLRESFAQTRRRRDELCVEAAETVLASELSVDTIEEERTAGRTMTYDDIVALARSIEAEL